MNSEGQGIRPNRSTGQPDILCFGTDWYSPSKVSIRQIVQEFQDRGSRVLWINPIPIRFPSTRKKDFWNKVQNKAKTHSRLLKKLGPGLHVYSPLYLPVYKGPGFLLNRLVVSIQIWFLRMLLGMRKPLVLGSTFTTWFALPAVRDLPLVFHFADKISAFREVADIPPRRRLLEDMEKELVTKASLCTCSSRSIFEHVLDLAGGDERKVRYFPHAIRHDLFFDPDHQPRVHSLPEDMDGIPGPRAGYFGSLTATNDQEAFVEAATRLPDWSFVFIGRVVGDYSTLQKLPNVFFLGPKDHHQIPAYGGHFDVCFMGWRAHEWITNCYPLKTLEYLALGKPIVCSGHIAELSHAFPGLIRQTEGPGKFAEALDEELRKDTAEDQERRRQAVLSETWTNRVDQMLGWLRDQGAGNG